MFKICNFNFCLNVIDTKKIEIIRASVLHLHKVHLTLVHRFKKQIIMAAYVICKHTRLLMEW